MVRQKRIHSWLRSLISHCRFAFRQTRKSPGARDLVAHQRFPKNPAKTLPRALEVAGRSFARVRALTTSRCSGEYRELGRWEALTQGPSCVRHCIHRNRGCANYAIRCPLEDAWAWAVPLSTQSIVCSASKLSGGRVLCDARHISHLGEIKVTSLRIQCE